VLANGFAARFVEDERIFASVEQYMMFNKARLFEGNDNVCADIMATADYATIKALGRRVRNFDPEVWRERCVAIVARGCSLKFSQNPRLLAYLLHTGDAPLGQTGDDAWSVGGENRLGEILQRVRADVWRGVLT
jgi:ribA/ribD-fused uncharacterized protein